MVGRRRANGPQLWLAAAAWACLFGACARPAEELRPAAGPAAERAAPREPVVDPTPGVGLFVATLTPLNEQAMQRAVTGRATFIADERRGTLRVTVEAENLSASERYVQYVHGSARGERTSCPTISADMNGDGIVDVAEIAPYGGAPLLPLNDERLSFGADPSRLPVADADGNLNYRAEGSLAGTRGAIRDRHGSQARPVETGIVVIYGRGDIAAVPDTVAPLAGRPREASIPLACGEIVRIG